MTYALKDFAINVRAVVWFSPAGEDGGSLVQGSPWEVYDAGADDGKIVLRCDTLVRVKAASDTEAVRTAKDTAPLIEVDGGEIVEIDIWLDEGIDINPEFAQKAQDQGPQA